MKALVIAGNIGKDGAVMRTTQNGKQVLGFSVAVNDGWGDNKRTLWFNCSLWGQRGEKLAGMLTQGTKVTVSGELSTDEYEGRTKLTLNVNDVTLQGSKQDNGQHGGASHSGQRPPQGSAPAGADDFGGTIPFAPETRI